MATMSEMRKRLRTLSAAAERVAAARLMNPTELSSAITCRNDAILSVELAFSALEHENAKLRVKMARLEGGTR
jgi:hypothetical protein